MNNFQKYVASTTLEEPLEWSNSTLLKGGAVEAVAGSRSSRARTSWSSAAGSWSNHLMRRGLIDEYVLLIHPLILGSGRRLFPDGCASATLRLVDSVTTTTGVIIVCCQPAEPTVGK